MRKGEWIGFWSIIPLIVLAILVSYLVYNFNLK